ncbi:MAG: AAA family ATPase [Gammaproteobacteria bacterium]|nr:AAA family ATPase [Gammaproteobacteria bacterium]NIR97324.1 AAA family ATPase [Gammaproteobacteria bacterium]NIT63367.1 AAA family ATPase [Gammaproteobacteria bacterium]NIV20294.1 AAA family ATPase [Gammaproteobacteria bacterium]NIX10711.1 AAA family ATPase [Gammaproteobacteria bacterium]
MSGISPLRSERLVNRCDPGQFSFETTAELEDLSEIVGQARALDALRFGVGVQREGYNLYVLGPPGIGKHTVVRQHLERQAEGGEVPPDWCYVNNFEQPHKPNVLKLPAGRGRQLYEDMEHFVDELGTALRVAFEAEEYQSRVQEVEEGLKEKREKAFGELAAEAERHGITLVRTPGGFAFAPVKEGEVLGPDEFEKLSDEERSRIEQVVSALQDRLATIFRQMPQWQREARERLKGLNREVAMFAVGHLIEDVKTKYADLAPVLEYLDAVEHDVVDNVDQLIGQEESRTAAGSSAERRQAQAQLFRRYKVNLLVDHAESRGTPVVYEDLPTYQNLIGAIEHLAQMGTLVTDFLLIRSGALHRANGGYLILDVRKVLLQPFAWEGLKRALNAGEVRIQSLHQIFSLISTVSLEPEPIPLDVKVVLMGDRLLYYLLCEYDPEFGELFKVAADFEDRVEASADNYQLYAQLIATLARKEGLLPFHRDGVARVIDRAARIVEDSERLSTHMLSVADLVRESDYWARTSGHDAVRREDVQHAIDMQVYRAERVRARIYEEIQRDTILIDTDGEKVGQLNGLSVITLGNFSFGQPSRITATARLGEGEVVDIEREVELGGAIHSKGVMILSSFLASRYAVNRPLSLKASLVFEQSYGMVEGDSASTAELCSLLSVLAQVPVRQGLAVTGSVNQHGDVQAIGGVNEKIEGFFDVCRARGLDGTQGVLIPDSNVKHLMLREDVVSTVAEGSFHVYPVRTVDQAIELLTGVPAGERDPQGNYPKGTINQRVEARLIELADYRQEYIRAGRELLGHD